MSSALETRSAFQSALANVLDSAECRHVIDQIRRGMRTVSISGLVASPARALAVAALQRETGKQFAVVVPAQRDLEGWERDLAFWYCALHGVHDCAEAVAVLPASESDPYAGGSPHAETLEKRGLALWRLARHRPRFALLTARALARRTVGANELLKIGATLRRDEDTAPEEVVDKLLACGYVREDPVGAVGEFSIRGGILDVWPPGRTAPARVEFFGDTVDSIREFDPETQLSTTQLGDVEIPPMRELAVRPQDFRDWAARARQRWSDQRFARSLQDRTVFADEGEDFPGWEWLISLGHRPGANAFEYFKDAVLVIDEPIALENFLANAFRTLADRYAENDAADDLGLHPDELYLSDAELRSNIDALSRIEFRALGRTAAKIDEELVLDAEEPEISVGKERARRRPLFLFPNKDAGKMSAFPGEVEWKSQSVIRYHGRLPDLARDIKHRCC